MKFRFSILMVLAAALIFAVGCSDDDPVSSNGDGGEMTTVWDDAGFWVTSNLDASSYDNYAFYNFTDMDVVPLSLNNARNSDAWDFGFNRVNVFVNSDDIGPGTVYAVDLATIGHADSADFEGFADRTAIDDSVLVGGSVNLVIDDWWGYDFMTHDVYATNNVYIIYDAEQNFVKFQIIAIENEGMENIGDVTIQYIYSGTSPDFTGSPETMVVNAATTDAYYIDFSTGSVVNPADPENSTDWDIAIEGYEIHQNNTIFGSGSTATFEIWITQTDPTDFDETSTAPTNAPYFADQFGSPLTDWYNYNNTQVSSKQHVYLVKIADTYYKMQITSYFNSDSGPSATGYYTFRWVEMD